MYPIRARKDRKGLTVGSAFLAVVVSGIGYAEPLPTSNDKPKYMEHHGAVREGPAGGAEILWLDEASRTRARVASSGSVDAVIFDQPNDSGFGWFMKNDDTLGFGTWAMRMEFGNGWEPGFSFSSYEARIYHSTSDDPDLGGADFLIELWDGDPMGIMETVCSIGGIPAPIPETDAIVANVPYGALVQARVELPVKVTYDCDRAWMVMTMLSGCRAAWRLAGDDGDVFTFRPRIGESNGIWLAYPCEAFGLCATDTGLGAGFCCGSPEEVCDHSVAGGIACTSQAAQSARFCGDGTFDYFVADYLIPDTEESYVASLFADAFITMSVVPVSVDEIPPSSGNGPGVISLGGDEVVLDGGDHNVWFEVMLGNWNPHTLAGYQANVNWLDYGRCSESGGSCLPAIGPDCPVGETCDGAGGSLLSGLQGTLEQFRGPDPCGTCDDNGQPCYGYVECTSGVCSGTGDPCHERTVLLNCPSGQTCVGSASCVSRLDGDDICEAALGEGALCGPKGLEDGTCSFAFVNPDDPRWALRDAGATLLAVDAGTRDESRLGAAVVVGPPSAPDPFPSEGMYAATFALHVPADARGTFTISLKTFPFSSVQSGAGPPISLLGVVPGKLTIQTGRCCFNLPTGEEGCLDELQTAGSCAQFDGAKIFTANLACPANGGPPCACDPDIVPTFDDHNACTEDECFNFVPTYTPKDCPNIGDLCFDYGCDPDDPTGVGCFARPIDVDDGLACTVDACSGSVETHRPVDVVDGDDCTFDYCIEPTGEIFHADLSSVPNAYPCPTGDPVADGCPGATGHSPVSTTCTDGYCHCIQCFSGITCSEPVCVTPDAPVPDLVPNGAGTWVTSTKNRFISFGDAYGACEPRKAARVTFVSMPRPYDLWEGHQLWVTSPVEASDYAESVQPFEDRPNFYAATLGCDGPTYESYGCMGMVHVFHEGIVPGGEYYVEFISEFCSPEVPGDFSPLLEISTSRMGDVVAFVDTVPPSAPDGDPDVKDFLSILKRFASHPGAIIKARADLEPRCVDLRVNISDVLLAVFGFKGLPYPFTPSAGDPCNSTCASPLR